MNQLDLDLTAAVVESFELPPCPICSRPKLDFYRFATPRQGRNSGRWFLEGCGHANALEKIHYKGNFTTRLQAVRIWKLFARRPELFTFR